MKRWSIFGLAAVMALSLSACGGGGGDSPTPSSDFTKTSTLKVVGVSTDAEFTTNGKFTVAFTAQDTDGNSILAGKSLDLAAISIKNEGGWVKTQTKAADSNVTCVITAPASTTGEPIDLTSTEPSSDAKVMGAPLIDDSGSMSTSDPTSDRATAANAFLDSVCGCTSGASCTSSTNMFGAFDFGAGSNLSFTYTQDFMTANGVTDGDLTGSKSALPYAECNDNNMGLAQTAVTDGVTASGSTPLYESVLELCENMAAKKAAGEQLEGYALAMLVLSDGVPDSETNKAAAEACLTTNSITACTVGLGPGSETENTGCACTTNQDCVDAFTGDTCSAVKTCLSSSNACTTDADCTVFGLTTCAAEGFCEVYLCDMNREAQAALKDLANAGGCVYASATDAAALEPIFDAIGIAVSEGFNSAIFALSPVPAKGTPVTGTLTVGNETATFSFTAP